MKIGYIIPTLFRETLFTTINSIFKSDINANVFIEHGNNVAENRNSAIQNAIKNNCDWIIFVDDDDYLLDGYLKEIDNNFDLIFLKMKRNSKVIPKNKSLACGNFGINFCLNLKTNLNIPYFENKRCEDCIFIKTLVKNNNINYKITKDIFYIAPSINRWAKPIQKISIANIKEKFNNIYYNVNISTLNENRVSIFINKNTVYNNLN